MDNLAINYPFVDGHQSIAFAAAHVFLRTNGWHLQRAPSRIRAEPIPMLASRRFHIAHLDPWLRGFAAE